MRPGAVARGAGLGDHLAGAVAGRAGLLDREEALRHPHLAAAVAAAAGLGLRAGLGAGALAGLAGLHRRHADLRLGAARRVLEREFEVVAQVGAAIDAVAAAPAALRAEDLAEDVAEGVGEAAEALRPAAEAARPRPGTEARRRVDAGVPELVVGGALLGVGEDLVGLLRLLEFLLGTLVVRVAVRVVLHRELAVGLLDVLFGRVPVDAQNRVVVALCHVSDPSPDPECSRASGGSRFEPRSGAGRPRLRPAINSAAARPVHPGPHASQRQKAGPGGAGWRPSESGPTFPRERRPQPPDARPRRNITSCP